MLVQVQVLGSVPVPVVPVLAVAAHLVPALVAPELAVAVAAVPAVAFAAAAAAAIAAVRPWSLLLLSCFLLEQNVLACSFCADICGRGDCESHSQCKSSILTIDASLATRANTWLLGVVCWRLILF